MNWEGLRNGIRKTWHFFWNDESAWSWLANVIVAFLLIRYVVYPLLGLLLGTSFPIVAVVSESMEHGLHEGVICGSTPQLWRDSFLNYWQQCGSWYEQKSISQEQFRSFPLRNGFDKGDVIVLWRATPKNLEVGDIIVFQGTKPQPVIHRVVRIWEEGEERYYQTKGDHNSDSIPGEYGELKIEPSRIYGKAVWRVPYLGWVKILFVDAVRPLGITIQR